MIRWRTSLFSLGYSAATATQNPTENGVSTSLPLRRALPLRRECGASTHCQRGRECGGSWLSRGGSVSRASVRHRDSSGCHNDVEWCSVAHRVAISRLNPWKHEDSTTQCAQRSSQTKLDHLSLHKSFFPLQDPPPPRRPHSPSPNPPGISDDERPPSPPTAKSGPCPVIARAGGAAATVKPFIPSSSPFSPSLLALPRSPSPVRTPQVHAIKPSIKPPPDIPINSATRHAHKLKNDVSPTPPRFQSNVLHNGNSFLV